MKYKVSLFLGIVIGSLLFTVSSAYAVSTFIVQQGGTGVNTFTSSQLLYGNGTNALSSVATTTASCSGSASCSSFTVIGSSPVTISASGGGGSAYPFTPSTFGIPVSATSTPLYPAGLITGTSTIGTLVASSSITNQSVKTALVLNGSGGLEGAYAGSTNPCSANQAPTTLSAVGALGGCTSSFLTSAITAIGPLGQTQTGATQTLATTSDTNIGLTITASGNIQTFTSTWAGTLATSRGGLGGSFSGSTGALSINSGTVTAGTLSVANGGTNSTSFASNVLIGSNAAGTTLIATGTPELTIGYLNATSTTASSTIQYALGIATSSPFATLSVGAGNSIINAETTLATTTTMTVDFRNGNQQLLRIGGSATSVSFSGAIAGATMRLMVCNPAGFSAGALTFNTVQWFGGTAPTQTTTANQCDLWSFVVTNGTSTVIIAGALSSGLN